MRVRCVQIFWRMRVCCVVLRTQACVCTRTQGVALIYIRIVYKFICTSLCVHILERSFNHVDMHISECVRFLQYVQYFLLQSLERVCVCVCVYVGARACMCACVCV